jgi:DNA-directed RNA polymerase specialized sigma24 family protein
MEDEGVLFEGLRLGSTQAFEEALHADDATMRRLARLYVADDQVAALVRQTWSVALPGLDMFTWHTTLRAWLTGILVTYGRARRPPPAAAPGPPGPIASPAPAGRTTQANSGGLGTAATVGVATEPLPWSTLGWSSLWSPDSWGVLEQALAARPLAEQEVLWLHDVEGWEWREVLDTLGLTAAEGADLRHRGRAALSVAVARHVGVAPGVAAAGGEDQRLEGVAALLSDLRPRQQETAPDPQLVRTFTSWRRHRGARAWRRWRWELGRRARPGRPPG